LSATDPIHGKSVSISDLKLSTPDEAMKYIQRYNNVVEKKAGGNNGEEGVQNGVNNQDGEDLDGINNKMKKKDGNGQGVDDVGVERSAPQSSKLKLDRAQKTKEKLKKSNAESTKN